MPIQDGQVILTHGKTLMTDVRVVLPFTPYFPAAGEHLDVFNALNNIFLVEKQVFQGKVDEIVEVGVFVGRDERALRRGFADLVRYGMLKIDEEGTFTPTDLYLKHLIGTKVSAPEGGSPPAKERK
jgi:hypothetical protein